MTKTVVEQYVEDPVRMRFFQQERAIYEVALLIESTMAELGVTRSELAKRLGKSRGWVTQLLNGQANKTIRTIADTLAVLGREYHSSQKPISVGKAHVEPSVTQANGVTRRVVGESDNYILKYPPAIGLNPQWTVKAL